jgi:hypothetical protein
MSTRQPSTIDWSLEEHQAKRDTDWYLIKYLQESGTIDKWKKLNRPMSLVTLCADNLIFETELLKKIPKSLEVNITPIERDIQVYTKFVKNLGQYLEQKNQKTQDLVMKNFKNCQLIVPDKPMDIYSYFSTKNYGAIDFINLDYMGTWSKEKEKDFAEIFTSPATASTYIIVITISGTRGNGNTNKKLKKLSDKKVDIDIDFGETTGNPDTFDAKTKGVVVNIMEIGKKLGVNVIPKKFFRYPGIGNKPEYKFVFEVKKK